MDIIKKITDEIYNDHVKPLSLHPQTGEQCETDYNNAIEIVDCVLEGLGIKRKGYTGKGNFEQAALTMIQYINENHHPHTTVLVTTDRAEVMQGVKSIITTTYVPD
jgi:hypothetical protein